MSSKPVAITAPTVGKLGRLWACAHLVILRWHLDCLLDERIYYASLGWIGEDYMRNSEWQEAQLLIRIGQAQDDAGPRFSEFLAVYRLYRQAHGPVYSARIAYGVAFRNLPF